MSHFPALAEWQIALGFVFIVLTVALGIAAWRVRRSWLYP